MSTDTDVIRRKNLIVASLIGAAIIVAVLGSFAGVVWWLAG